MFKLTIMKFQKLHNLLSSQPESEERCCDEFFDFLKQSYFSTSDENLSELIIIF